MNTKHTPTPFYVGAQNDALYIIAGERPSPSNDAPRHDANRTVVAHVYNAKDAAHIVHCVNNHDALVAALNVALEYFEDREDVVDGDYGIPAPNKEMLLASLLRSALLSARKSEVTK